MTTALSLILALMLSIGGSPSGVPGNTGIQAPIDNSCTINRIFEDYSQKTASRLFPKKIPEIVLIDQPKTQIRLIFTLPLKEKPLLMGYEDSMNLYQAFNMNPVNFTDPFGKDVLGSCAESYKYYLNPTENEETIEAHKRALALVGEGAANAAVKTFLFPAKYITLPARLLFGFDFDVSLNFTEEGSVVNAGIGQQNRLGIVKAQTVVYPLADFVTQTGYDAYFGLSYQGGNSSLGKSSRENLARSAGALEFNALFWGNVSKSIQTQTRLQATYNSEKLREIRIEYLDEFKKMSKIAEKALYNDLTDNQLGKVAEYLNKWRLEWGKIQKEKMPLWSRLKIYYRNIAPDWFPKIRLKGVWVSPKGYDTIYGPSIDWFLKKGFSYIDIIKKAVTPSKEISKIVGVE